MQSGFLVCFTLVWSALVLGFDGFLAHGIFKQYESRQYPATVGQVTHSEVRSHRGSKGGTSYEAVVNYRFEVGGQAWAGARLCYNAGFSSDQASARSIVAAPLAGATVRVFYDPANPQDSLLSPGISGADVISVLFLTPFNAVMLGSWLWVGGWLRERIFRPVAGGVKIITDGMFTRVRLPQYGAAARGLATTGGLGFVSIFILGFTAKMQPSIGLAVLLLGVVYLAGAGAYLWRRWKIGAGVDDLVINQAGRVIELPQAFGRKQRVTANIAEIESLTVEKIEHRGRRGGISYTYAPTLRLRGTEAGGQKLADWSDQMRADDFAAWLRQQLGV